MFSLLYMIFFSYFVSLPFFPFSNALERPVDPAPDGPLEEGPAAGADDAAVVTVDLRQGAPAHLAPVVGALADFVLVVVGVGLDSSY